MSAQGYMSGKEWDDLDAKVRMAEVELRQAEHDLSETRIVAPFSGRVVMRSVNHGETVTPGRECFTLVDFDPLLARVYFPERELRNVSTGQIATLTSDAAGGAPVQGRVWLVNPAIDKSNGTFKVTVAVPNGDGALRPGGFARVRLTTGTRDGVLTMPKRGVLTEDGESFVFEVRGDSVVRVPVTVGAVEGERVQIVAGVEAGDHVVTVGQGGLKNGSKIRVVTF
jgi:membrane fusion protein (multidrug efflux system)